MVSAAMIVHRRQPGRAADQTRAADHGCVRQSQGAAGQQRLLGALAGFGGVRLNSVEQQPLNPGSASAPTPSWSPNGASNGH